MTKQAVIARCQRGHVTRQEQADDLCAVCDASGELTEIVSHTPAPRVVAECKQDGHGYADCPSVKMGGGHLAHHEFDCVCPACKKTRELKRIVAECYAKCQTVSGWHSTVQVLRSERQADEHRAAGHDVREVKS